MDTGPEPDATRGTPEFGPRGYLPERAARRARKIVLRAPLGLQWVVAALVAGALVLGRGSAPPGPPWESLGPVAALAPSAVHGPSGLLIVSVGDRVRAFEADAGVSYCAASNRLEHPDGRVWALTGRGTDSTASLVPVPTLVVAGIAYLDADGRGRPSEPLPERISPGC